MAVQSYEGSCQCGVVRYEVNADLDQLLACNCSRCGRLGMILTFVSNEEFKLLSGEDSLSEYLFNRHVIHHVFCKVCGVESFARGTRPDGTPMVAINVRCLEGIDPHELEPKKIDGRSR